MADIFLSYSSTDREWVQGLAHALNSLGWTTWWDRKTPIGKSFRSVLEEEIDAAKCVVVVWTPQSVASNWVITEAEEGKRRNVLVPVTLNGPRVPFGFRHLQAANLDSWKAGTPDAEFDEMVTAIQAIAPQTRAKSNQTMSIALLAATSPGSKDKKIISALADRFSVELPKEFYPLSDFVFRQSANEQDILRASSIEYYTNQPDSYSIAPLIRRWHAYQRGNWLIEKGEKLVGAIDIWPLTPDGFERFLKDGNENQDFENCIAEAAGNIECSTWYFGSIAVDAKDEDEDFRKTVISVLLGGVIHELYESPSQKPSLIFPSRMCAISWSKPGAKLLIEIGFLPIGRDDINNEIYILTIENSAKLQSVFGRFIASYMKFANQLGKV